MTGYIAAFPENDTHVEENPNYVTAWLTHGMLEASIAGNTIALPLIRAHLNWFNNNTYLPLFLPPIGGAESWDPNFYPNPYGNEFGGGGNRPPDACGDGTFTKVVVNKTTGTMSEVTCGDKVRPNGGIGCSNHHALNLMYALITLSNITR